MSSLSVVFLGNFVYPDGMAEAKRIQHFIDAVMSEAGNSAGVLLLRQNHPARNPERLSGVHHGVPFMTIGHDVDGVLGFPAGLLRYLRRGATFLRQQFRRDCLNVLFVYGEPNIENVPFILRARSLGYRVIVDVTEDLYLTGSDASLASRLKAYSARLGARYIARLADAVIVISGYLEDKFSEIVGRRIPVCQIPVAVDLQRICASVAPFHRPIRVLYAGSFDEKDGVENLIAAFDGIAGVFGEVDLVLTGKGMIERMTVIDEKIAACQYGSRIHYLGFLPNSEYFDVLNGADILCVVRIRSEFAERGFPFKLGEYLATGRPVIASAVGDIPNYLRDRESALLVEPGSVAAIGDALRYLLSDQNRALKIGAAGRSVAEASFGADLHGRSFVRLARSLFSRG